MRVYLKNNNTRIPEILSLILNKKIHYYSIKTTQKRFRKLREAKTTFVSKQNMFIRKTQRNRKLNYYFILACINSLTQL